MRSWLLVAPIGLALAAPALAELEYPASPVEEVVEDLHGNRVVDPYRWLEDGAAPRVEQWIDAQNALTRSLLHELPERAAVASELERLYAAHVAESPLAAGDRLFYQRREGLAKQPRLFVSRGRLGAGERVLLDPNRFREDGTAALDWFHPSPDGKRLAYGRSEAGSERSTLYLLDVDSGAHLEEVIPNTRFASVAWRADGSGFYYTRYPAAGEVAEGDENYYRRLYYHRLGDDPARDRLVFGDGRPKEEWIGAAASSDHRWLLVQRSLDWTRNDLFLRPLDGGTEMTPVAVGLDGQFEGEVVGETLYLLTNLDAPRYRVVKAPVATPGPEHWVEVLPQQQGVIKSLTVAAGRLVLHVLEDARSRLLVYDLDGQQRAEVPLSTLGTVDDVRATGDRKAVHFAFASFAYPNAVFRYEVAGGKLAVAERMPLEVDPADYETRQIWFASKDGTRVPMFVVHKKGVRPAGDAPTLLHGYGGFEVSQTPQFRRDWLVWLERGGVAALANLRGGGEFGREWHEAGRLEKKQNVFDDFIAAGESLVREGYTNRERLAIMGGSNGGLLTGACLVQRPELWRAVVVAVPLLDMLRYHQFSIARLWIPEYGSADDPEQFGFLRAYSPYHNVKDGVRYPAVLLTTADTDTRVDPMHARKMAARLQAAQAGSRPILFRQEIRAGHGKGKPLDKFIEERADIYTFLLWQTGALRSAPRPGASR